MADFYAVYKLKLKEDAVLNSELISQIEHEAEFIRWDWTDSYFEGIRISDFDLLVNESDLVYVYVTDSTVLPFHQDEEIKRIVIDRLFEAKTAKMGYLPGGYQIYTIMV